MMSLNRRGFLGALVFAGTTAAARPKIEPGDPSWLFREAGNQGFSILQGMTDETTSQFSLVLPKGTTWRLRVIRQDGGPDNLIVSSRMVSKSYSDFVVAKLEVSGLQLGVEYLLLVLDDGRGGIEKDRREFRALDLSTRPVRLAFVSCALDLFHRDDVWEKFEAQDPEAALFLGDNVYADRTSLLNKNPADEKQLWERYVLTRNRVRFYFHRKLVPVLATWDDHDYGADNAGADFPHKAAARFTFDTFFAQEDRPSLLSGPGIAKRWSAFGADFYFLDGRSFREDKGGKLFGAEQEQWLWANAQAKPSWLMSGSQFFGAYTGRDSFEGPYANNFKDWMTRLSTLPSLFCFASGDVHFSEVMDVEEEQLGYETFELVSSSIHSFTFPGHEHRYSNPRRRTSTSAHNFVMFQGRFRSDSIEGELVSHSAEVEEFRTAVWVGR